MRGLDREELKFCLELTADLANLAQDSLRPLGVEIPLNRSVAMDAFRHRSVAVGLIAFASGRKLHPLTYNRLQ